MCPPPDVGIIGRVQSVAFAFPLLPGQAEATRIALASRRPGAPKVTRVKDALSDALCALDHRGAVAVIPGERRGTA